MVFGKGMRDRGALCDRIPMSTPGVAFVALDGDPTPMRVRFSFLTDNQIRALARELRRPTGHRRAVDRRRPTMSGPREQPQRG